MASSNSNNAFLSDKIGSAYFGVKGFTLSNKFLINQHGQINCREGVLGGYHNQQDSFSAWTQGWHFRQNQIYSKWSSGNTIDFSALNTRYLDSTYSLILSSPSETDYTKAAFKMYRDGQLNLSGVDASSTDYGRKAVLKVVSWNTNGADTTVNFQTNINPNSIYFYNNKQDVKYNAGRITYVPGNAYGTENSTNGNYISFSCPIKSNSVYLTPSAIRYITYGEAGSSYYYPDTYYFYVGPNETDARNLQSKYTRSPAGYTVLRGRAIMLHSFGGSGNDSGNILMRGGSVILDNTTYLQGLKKGYKNPSTTGAKQILIGLNSNNRVVVGSSDNTGAVSICTSKYIYFKTNGKSGDKGTQFVLFAGPLNFGTANSKKIRMAFRPQYSGSARLGTANYKWYKVYATITSIGSDRRLKENIQPIDAKYLQFFDLLKPVSFNYNEIEIKDKDERKKKYLGFIAQDVEEALEKSGIDSSEFGALEKPEIQDGEEIYYSLDYTKFVALNTAKIKQLESIIQKQQEQINLLLSKLN